MNQVQKLAEFLGAKSDSQFIQEVCDRCSFNKLKDSYKNLKKGIHEEKDLDPNAFAFRKGNTSLLMGRNIIIVFTVNIQTYRPEQTVHLEIRWGLCWSSVIRSFRHISRLYWTRFYANYKKAIF